MADPAGEGSGAVRGDSPETERREGGRAPAGNDSLARGDGEGEILEARARRKKGKEGERVGRGGLWLTDGVTLARGRFASKKISWAGLCGAIWSGPDQAQPDTACLICSVASCVVWPSTWAGPSCQFFFFFFLRAGSGKVFTFCSI